MPDQTGVTQDFKAKLANANASLIRTAATLRDLIERSSRLDIEDPVSDEHVVVAYHQHRIASEQFDKLSREYVDRVAGYVDP